MVAHQLQSASASSPAARQKWAALQSQINGYLRAIEIQGLTTFADTSLFNGNGDPFCGQQMVSAGACLDQDYAVHQQEHEASCRAGRWNWQNSWTEPDMLDEEGGAIQKEMQAIQETIKHLGCAGQPTGFTGNSTPTTPANHPMGVCPQFTVVIQNVTQASVNIPGALMAQSGRSLNNGQGVWIPLNFHPDGTFEGFGSGADSGTAAGVSPGETVHSQFGHMQSIAASGFIRSGSCATQPCQPDVMHLVLAGGPSQQVAQAQARGELNRDFSETTAASGAVVVFDLPAYIGGSAQKTFLSSPLLNSYMTVNLAQGNNGAPALPQGDSLRYSLQQCQAASRPPARDGGGAAGVLIPGLEASVPIAAPPKANNLGGGAGIVIPGLEGTPLPLGGGTPKADKGPIVIHVDEKINAVDSPTPTNAAFIAVNEMIHVGDAPAPLPAAQISVSEAIQVSDDLAKTQSTIIHVAETISVGEVPLASATASLPRIPSTVKTRPK